MDQMMMLTRMEGVPVPPIAPLPPANKPIPPVVPSLPIAPPPPANKPTPPTPLPPQNCCMGALAMAYVPVQQWQDIYEPEVALARGTLFAQLDKPFIGEEVRFV